MDRDEEHFRAVLRYVERDLLQALRVRSHADGTSAGERQLHEVEQGRSRVGAFARYPQADNKAGGRPRQWQPTNE